MSKETLISWTDHTFNVVWGCTKISPGCARCYANTLAERYGFAVWGAGGARRTFSEKHWQEPLQWAKAARADGVRRRVFCGSMMDWAEDHPVTRIEIGKLWPLIRATAHSLDWLLLTKRADRIALSLPAEWGDGWPNVWLGVSVENADYVCRVNALRQIPATVRFVSYEPALGPLDGLNLEGIAWLICGGESGPGFRGMSLQWARDLRQRCRAASVAFFFKQSPAIRTEMATLLDGEEVHEFPTPGALAYPRQLSASVPESTPPSAAPALQSELFG